MYVPFYWVVMNGVELQLATALWQAIGLTGCHRAFRRMKNAGWPLVLNLKEPPAWCEEVNKLVLLLRWESFLGLSVRLIKQGCVRCVRP